METEKLLVSPKSEVFTMTVVDMMGEENEKEQGEVKVSLGADGDVRVSDSFGARETFLVALRCWSDGCNTRVGEDWLAKILRDEEAVSDELSEFSITISEDLVVKETDGGYVFEDSLGIEYDYEETLKIINNMADYFAL